MLRPQLLRLAALLPALAILASALAAALEADYVIIGGGTAGCALAARLCTALPDASITLLERSLPRTADEELLVRAAGNMWQAWADGSVTESFESAPVPGLLNRTIGVRTGNTLGGSSSINGAQWTMPSLESVEAWGFKGLTADRAKQLYAKAARQIGATVPATALQQTYTRDYFAAASAAGVPELEAPVAASVGAPAADTLWVNRVTFDRQGRRVDSCTGYLQPVMRSACRDNLTLRQGATATRILIDKDRAVGVEFIQAPADLESQIIMARREVISSAGPYASPKLLQLSGIGPADLLARHGIPLVTDLPVGAAAQGRALAQVLSSFLGRPPAPENNVEQLSAPDARSQFAAGDGGVLAVSGLMVDGVLRNAGAYLVASDMLPGKPGVAGHAGIWSACQLNPTSFSTVAISSSNPQAQLDVFLNLLGSEAEAAAATACLLRVRVIHAGFPDEYRVQELVPGLAAPLSANDHEATRLACEFASHFVGGCAVGSVLEADLKVKGFQNLRVVDASAIPAMPEYAGPVASVYMLAEYAAEELIAQHRPSAMRG